MNANDVQWWRNTRSHRLVLMGALVLLSLAFVPLGLLAPAMGVPIAFTLVGGYAWCFILIAILAHQAPSWIGTAPGAVVLQGFWLIGTRTIPFHDISEIRYILSVADRDKPEPKRVYTGVFALRSGKRIQALCDGPGKERLVAAIPVKQTLLLKRGNATIEQRQLRLPDLLTGS